LISVGNAATAHIEFSHQGALTEREEERAEEKAPGSIHWRRTVTARPRYDAQSLSARPLPSTVARQFPPTAFRQPHPPAIQSPSKRVWTLLPGAGVITVSSNRHLSVAAPAQDPEHGVVRTTDKMLGRYVKKAIRNKQAKI
jgi:hypothetical protein